MSGIDASRSWLRVGLGMFTVAFGANVFAPLLPAYRDVAGLSQPQVTFLLAIYVLGLVPALLIGGPLSDTQGRRALIRPALILGGVGSVVLALGTTGSFAALILGRFIAGVAIGLVMAAGAAWLQELSAGPAHVGARRATVALSLGFGGGPLLGGLIAQFLPHPDLLPYLVHLGLLTLIAPVVWMTPGGAPHKTQARRALFSRSVLSRDFLWAVAAWAPWGFGAVSTSFATLTALVSEQVSWTVAFTGVIAAVTMATGVLVQPLATRFGSDLVPPAILGLGFVVAGMLVSTAVAVTRWPWLVIVAAVLLGAAYGIMMVSGLREVKLIAPPAELGAATAVFYSLTYVGFFAPLALSYLGPALGYPPLFIMGALIAVASIPPVVRVAKGRGSSGRPH
ncbi:MAG: MFS transporter [Corynebacterium sp.]|uniref:MFS transporter n=1 Tax=Corynebacterium sp. TaxID=1720 RepID=UPI0026E0C157|nr:MFS transporter [Corynebacterium sp.]MDO5669780.1 MFS transporter [Corynebacterium sp.]